jgi:hypothetical protein
MKQQNFEQKNEAILEKFLVLKKLSPERLATRLNLSWSNWGFGLESLSDSAKRLEKAQMFFIELHGNHYGPDLGYKVDETLGDHGRKVSGVCECSRPTTICRAIGRACVRPRWITCAASFHLRKRLEARIYS